VPATGYTGTMLEPLRQRTRNALHNEAGATLSTTGSGGIQAGYFPCEADGLTLYLLVPASSDVLFNLETESSVVVTTPRWQLEGEGRVRCLSDAPPSLDLARSSRAAGCVLVAISGRRIHLNWAAAWGFQETIDL
jgi:hypothetical protein